MVLPQGCTGIVGPSLTHEEGANVVEGVERLVGGNTAQATSVWVPAQK
jgi:hypothetical protein